jgi:hypothetical protein
VATEGSLMPIYSFHRGTTLPALLTLAVCATLLLEGCSGGSGGAPGSPGLSPRREGLERRAVELVQRRHLVEQRLRSRVLWSVKLARLRESFLEVSGVPDRQVGLDEIRLEENESTGRSELSITGWSRGPDTHLVRRLQASLTRTGFADGFEDQSVAGFDPSTGRWSLEFATVARPGEKTVPGSEIRDLSPDLAVIALEEVVNRDERIILDSTENGLFISVVGDYERRSGVVVTGLKGLRPPGHPSHHPTPSAPVYHVGLRTDLRGSVDQLILFMNLLENHKRLVMVTGFCIERGKSPGPAGTRQLEMTLEFNFLHAYASVRTDVPHREILRGLPEVKAAIASFIPLKLESCELAEVHTDRDLFRKPDEATTPPVAGSAEPTKDIDAPDPEAEAERLLEGVEIERLVFNSRNSAFAIINGRILSEGDYVDTGKRILVKSIRKDAIEFVCDGRTITRRR